MRRTLPLHTLTFDSGDYPLATQAASQSRQDNRSTRAQAAYHTLPSAKKPYDATSGGRILVHHPNPFACRISALHTLAFDPGGHLLAAQAASQSRQDSCSIPAAVAYQKLL